jgi:hypothetical protein
MKAKTIDCPRCGEGDERPLGLNVCGLCECRFVVRANGELFVPSMSRRIGTVAVASHQRSHPTEQEPG